MRSLGESSHAKTRRREGVDSSMRLLGESSHAMTRRREGVGLVDEIIGGKLSREDAKGETRR